MRPFKNEEEIEMIKKERESLITIVTNFNTSEDEKRFILRRINIITEKLLEQAMYTGTIK